MSASAALDEVMTKVPLEQATPGIKAALAGHGNHQASVHARGHEAPPHRQQLSLALALNHRVDIGGRADVVARLRIAGRRVQRQPVQSHKLWPCKPVSEAPAHEREYTRSQRAYQS
jgi:hypothetical protein